MSSYSADKMFNLFQPSDAKQMRSCRSHSTFKEMATGSIIDAFLGILHIFQIKQECRVWNTKEESADYNGFDVGCCLAQAKTGTTGVALTFTMTNMCLDYSILTLNAEWNQNCISVLLTSLQDVKLMPLISY